MQTMVRDYSQDQLQTIKGFFTEDEWDAIDSALADYQDYGDKESDLMNSVGNKMYQLFNPKLYVINKPTQVGHKICGGLWAALPVGATLGPRTVK